MLMRAIVRDERGVGLRRVPTPRGGAGEVIVAIRAAGVCRTDLRVAGEAGPSVILGHEAAGVVVGSGERVTIIPWVDRAGAGPAAEPSGAPGATSPTHGWLGVDRDGVFAEQVAVPAAQVRRLPDGMSFALGAYVEPVAAAMGALRAPIGPGTRVLVGGANRIAELTARVVAAAGATVVRAPDGAVDVAIESDGALAPLIAALRPGGTLVVKSRTAAPAALDLAAMVAGELIVRGLGHGSFDAAIDWLASGRIVVDDLIAPARPLEDWAGVFAAARGSEAHKQMFAVAG